MRAAETGDKHQERIRKQAERQAVIRANQTQEQQLIERSKARARMTAGRKYTSAGFKDATKTQDILQGKFKLIKLENSVDVIGTMTNLCNFCGALKFSKEMSRTTSCCSEGKIHLEPFPRPPELLMDLWMGNDVKSRIFKQHSRQLNKAVCLSSLQVKERNMTGFNPSFVFQGKVHHRAGALIPQEGEQPRFGQLYVYDAALESTKRYQNLRIPITTSNSQKAILKEVLQIVQNEIHENNPYVQDFKQIIEMSEEEVGEGKIVISAKGPVNEHAQRYNAPTT